jgi:hypothetical protein
VLRRHDGVLYSTPSDLVRVGLAPGGSVNGDLALPI